MENALPFRLYDLSPINDDFETPIVAHCNVSSLKHFLNNGFQIDKGLFKVVKEW